MLDQSTPMMSDEDMRAVLQSLVVRLTAEAERRVGLRGSIENRWIEDLQQYHGVYNADTMARLRKVKDRSRLNINLTRPKTNAMSARLMDLLFPTDDRNWGIGPTPVPEMTDRQQTLQRTKDDATGRLKEADIAGKDPETPEADLAGLSAQADQAEAELSEVETAIRELQDITAEARRRSDLMQAEIDDQLKACQYHATCRDVIDDACKIGTGVIKGPVLDGKISRKWAQTDQGYVATETSDLRPSFKRIDPWSFFPDPDCREIIDGEGIFERHLLNKTGMRKLARREEVDSAALARLLKKEPDAAMQSGNLVSLYSLTGESTNDLKSRYKVWEYSGPITVEEFAALMKVSADEIDILAEIHARVTFCDGEILSFAMHPMDSNEPIYSVFNLHKDETTPFGYGIPYLMRDPASALNAAWRMMMDNARISAGPQVVVNTDLIKPEENAYELAPFKVWKRRMGTPGIPAFESYNLEMNQGMMQSIIEMVRRDIDDVTAMPMITQGEQGTEVTKTFNGMAMLMNSANVVFRRIVKNFDDDVTVPNIRRNYDFNMQFSEKEEIKGDYEVDARGSSVLLVREMQSNNLLLFAQTFGDHPEYGLWIKKPDLLRQITRSMMIPVEEIIHTQTEYDENLRKQQQMAGEQPDPMIALKEQELELRRAEIDAKVSIAEMESSSRKEVAQLQYNGMMMQATEKLNQMEADRTMKVRQSDVESGAKERALATEVAMKLKTGDGAGGSV